jgi:hypothetical protein
VRKGWSVVADPSAVLEQISLGEFFAWSVVVVDVPLLSGREQCEAGLVVEPRRTLARLTEQRVLARLTRRSVGGLHAGSASFIYTLGPIGNRLAGDRRRVHEPSVAFLDHALAVADVHVTLAREARAGGIELVEVVTEPECWRRSLQVGGGVDVLRPDLYVVTATGEYEHCWFVEVDRGTASLPAVVRKCHDYLAYRNTGQEQKRTGTFPLVLWITPDAERKARVEQAIRRNFPTELFRVTVAEGFVASMNGGAR